MGRGCGAVFLPKETAFCRNPGCAGTGFDEVALSRCGTLWPYTDNRRAPPAPYVAADLFEPDAIAAVELAGEKLVILGGHKGFTRLFSNRPMRPEVTIPLWVFDRRRGIQPGRAAAGPLPGQ